MFLLYLAVKYKLINNKIFLLIINTQKDWFYWVHRIFVLNINN